jgi:hypothetical protein
MDALLYVLVPVALALVVNLLVYALRLNKTTTEEDVVERAAYAGLLPPGLVIGFVWVVLLGLLGLGVYAASLPEEGQAAVAQAKKGQAQAQAQAQTKNGQAQAQAQSRGQTQALQSRGQAQAQGQRGGGAFLTVPPRFDRGGGCLVLLILICLAYPFYTRGFTPAYTRYANLATLVAAYALAIAIALRARSPWVLATVVPLLAWLTYVATADAVACQRKSAALSAVAASAGSAAAAVEEAAGAAAGTATTA